MSRSPILLVSLLLVLCWALKPGPASLQGTLEARLDELNDSDFPVLRASVTVTDAFGRPVAGLQSEQFAANLGGMPLTVTQVQSAADNDIPMGLVLAFDESGSMEGPPLEQAREAGRALIDQLLPIDQVAVLSFATGVQVVQPFTADRALLLQAIDGLRAGGDTALYGAVAESSSLAAGSTLARRAVVLLSDGYDYGGRSTVDRATSLEAVGRAGIPVFVVGLGSQIDQPYLEELAAAARTPLMLAPSPEDLHALYSRIGQSLRYQYVVTVNASTAPPGEALLRLSVTYDGSVVVAERPFTVPAPPEPPAPLETPPPSTPPPPPVEALPAPTPATSDRGISTFAPVIAGVAVALAALAAAVPLTLRHRRRQRRQAEAGLEQRVQSLAPPDTPPVPAPATEEPVAADVVAELLVVNEAAGAGRYWLTGAPATIGFTPDCTVVLGHDDHLTGEERVRIWRREGKFMLHRLSRRGRVAVGGRPVAGAVLEDGDEIEVGPWRLRFSLRPEAAPPVPRHHARG